jgi:hypothetical protein
LLPVIKADGEKQMGDNFFVYGFMIWFGGFLMGFGIGMRPSSEEKKKKSS